MIWIVSKSIIQDETELEKRREYIRNVTYAKVSNWTQIKYISKQGIFQKEIDFYQCSSDKNEYGVIITAHIEEVCDILNFVLRNKAALIIVNSCKVKEAYVNQIIYLAKNKSKFSEVFFAKQEKQKNGLYLNCQKNVGNFGFSTTKSERELFQHRENGFIKSIRKAYEKVI